jgi:ribosomal protein S18 acetylase RimI-like enzyme
MGMVRLPGGRQGWRQSTVAELDGKVVGVLQSNIDFSLTPQLFLLAVQTFGVGLVSILPRLRARQRVEPDQPEGSYHISEFDVDPAYRNRRIGGAMFEYIEGVARRDGYAVMSLVTTTNNPARRLYERHGFRVAGTRTDADYERYTGIEGRHLMVKELT